MSRLIPTSPLLFAVPVLLVACNAGNSPADPPVADDTGSTEGTVDEGSGADAANDGSDDAPPSMFRRKLSRTCVSSPPIRHPRSAASDRQR